MSILSPLTGLVSSSLPMVAGLLKGERLGITGYLAIGCALAAVFMVGFTREKRAIPIRPTGIAMALGSGAMFGTFLILMDMTPHDSGLIPLVVSRAATATVMIAALLLTGRVASRRRTPSKAPLYDRVTAPTAIRYLFEQASSAAWKRGVRIAMACGVLDSTGSSLQIVGLRVGELSVMSVLNGLYPTVIVILAAVVLNERITRLQLVGLLAALTAAALFSLS
jgi:drug/metabolite transporter (DMT)-like permease